MAPEYLFYLTWIIAGSFELCKTEPAISDESGIRRSSIYFTDEPKDTVVRRGSSVLLDCSARIAGNGRRNRVKSHDILEILWLKNGELLDTETSTRHHIMRNGSLKIKKVKLSENHSDEGVYQCLAKNGGNGTRASRTAQLQVAYLQRLRDEDYNPVVNAYDGEVIRLTCNMEGLPLPSYIWTKDGNPLPQGSRFIQLPSGVLEILGVAPSDEGEFQCTAYNVARNRTSPKVSLEVRPASISEEVKILAYPVDVVAAEGKTVVLECTASGNPLPQVTWTNQDSLPIPKGLPRFNELGDSHNLQILSVEPQDTGAYVCNIITDEKTDQYPAWLEVDEIPRLLTIYSGNQEYDTGIIMFIQCQFKGSPINDVIWMKDGQKITNKNRYSVVRTALGYERDEEADTVRILRVINTVKEDAGIYQCFMENRAGQASGTLQITVTQAKNAPDPPTEIQAITLSHDSILLKWKYANSKLPIIAFSGHWAPVEGDDPEEQNVVNASKTNMTIKPLQANTKYRIYMQAYNTKFSSVPSLPIEQTTSEDKPSGAPAISCVEPSEPTNLHITWIPLLKTFAKGKITQYRLYVRKHGEADEPVEERDLKGDLLDYKVESLEPGQSYDMRLQPVNKMGFAEIREESWPWTTCTTSGNDNGTAIRVDSLASGGVRVTWKSPVQSSLTTGSPPATVSEYSLSCQDVKTKTDVFAVNNLPPNCYNYTVESLEPAQEYLFSLTVKYEDGTSEVYQQKYFVAGLAHIQITALPLGPDQIKVTWDTLQWDRCDPSFVLTYKSLIKGKSDHSEEETLVLKNVNSPVIINDLQPYTQYAVSITGTCMQPDVKPHQQQSRMIKVRTQEAKPSKPETFLVLGGSAIELKWTKPLQPNGLISHYSVYYTQDEELDLEHWTLQMEFGNATGSRIKGLETEKTYYFKVCANTAAGQGEFTEVQAIMTGEIPTPGNSDKYSTELGIILGMVIGGGCIILCTVVLLIIYLKPCLLRCCCKRQHSNLHDNNTANHAHVYPYGKHTSQDVEFRQPMLMDNHIDTKGGKSPPEVRGLSNGNHVPTMELYNGSVRSNLLPFDCEQETSFGPDNTQLPLTTNSIGESQETADTGYSEPQELDGDEDLDVDLEDAISDIDTSTQLADSPQNSFPCSCSVSPDTDPMDPRNYIDRQRHHRDCHFYDAQENGYCRGQEFFCNRHSASDMVKPPLLRSSSSGEYVGHYGNPPPDIPPVAADADAPRHYQNTSIDQQASEEKQQPHLGSPFVKPASSNSCSSSRSSSRSSASGSPIQPTAPYCQTSVAADALPSQPLPTPSPPPHPSRATSTTTTGGNRDNSNHSIPPPASHLKDEYLAIKRLSSGDDQHQPSPSLLQGNNTGYLHNSTTATSTSNDDAKTENKIAEKEGNLSRVEDIPGEMSVGNGHVPTGGHFSS